MILRRSPLTWALAAVLLAGVAPAATERRTPSRLDARVFHREGDAIPVAPRRLDGWKTFGDEWQIYLDERSGRPTLVAGPGLAWFSGNPTRAELDGKARQLLADTFALDDGSVLELDDAASLELLPAHWQLVYRQSVDGVRVENARIDVHVVNGRMVLLGAEHWGRPTTDGIPTVDAAQAAELFVRWLDADAVALSPGGQPELTLVAVEGLRHVLLWRLRFDEVGTDRTWIGEVDAHDGETRAFYESTDYATIHGGVFPLGTDGDCATGGCEVSGFPMPYADFTETGQGVAFADTVGNLTCSVAENALETTLSGPYVNIADTCGALAESGDCATGVDLGVKAGENCAVAAGASAGNTGAARTAYYQINRVAEVARFYDPANAWLNAPLTVNVNVNGTCNANWSAPVINMYGSGNNCNNTGENTGILVHEWGHGYDHNDGGGAGKPGEAYADIVSILTTHASCMGRGMYNDGSTCTGYGDTCLSCTGFRDFDWAARQSGTPATPTNFAQVRCQVDTSSFGGPCNREAHCESYISSEAMFDLATRDLPAMGLDPASAWQLAERLWYLTRPGAGGNAYTCLLPLSNSCSATSWYQRMRVADDDDGDLANGTPHAAALFAAFDRHDIACGAAGDVTNQNHSSCPALAAPVPTRTLVPGGVELQWSPVAGAAEYRVFRGELGCEHQQVPVAALPAGQTSYVDDDEELDLLRHYRVQAFGSNPACAGPVSACVGVPLGSRLQQASHRVIDDGDGVPEPGETLELPVTLFNSGADAATSVAGTLTLLAPAQARLLRSDGTWPMIASNGMAESDAPYFEVVLLEDSACGQTLTLELNGAADNSPAFSSTIEIPMGDPQRDFAESSIVVIPMLTTTPVETTFTVDEDRTISDLDVTLDIFHLDPTQLIVELTSPQGTTVRLHDRSAGSGHGIETRYDQDTAPDGPGSMADFVGESALGTWTLSVQDVDASGPTIDGYIRPRTLHVTTDGGFGCDPQSCAEPTPTEAPELQVALDPNGADLVLSWSAVAGSAGYHVLRSADATLASGVELIANPTSATPLTLTGGAQAAPALTFFQVRAVNTCHQEGP